MKLRIKKQFATYWKFPMKMSLFSLFVSMTIADRLKKRKGTDRINYFCPISSKRTIGERIRWSMKFVSDGAKCESFLVPEAEYWFKWNHKWTQGQIKTQPNYYHRCAKALFKLKWIPEKSSAVKEKTSATKMIRPHELEL